MKKKLVKYLKARLTPEQLDRLRSIASGVTRLWLWFMFPYARFFKGPYKRFKSRKKSERRLEIGPGLRRIPGFETVNVHWGPHIDYVADASKKLPFKTQTFDLIYASHVLEHIPWYLTARVLRDWVGVLKSGGSMEIWVPNGYQIARAFIQAEENEPNDIPLDGWYRFNEERDPCIWANGRIFSYGDGTGRRGDSNWHLSLFSPRFLRKVMSEAGLVNLQSLTPGEVRGYDHGWINLGIRGFKP